MDSAAPSEAASQEAGSGGDTGVIGEAGEAGEAAASVPLELVKQTNLIADTDAGGAPFVDPNLQNAWGLAFSPTGVAWVSENGTDLLAVYPGPAYDAEPFAVAVTPPGDAGAAAPSGQVFNPGSKAPDGGVGAFLGDLFIASGESGIVAGWQGKDGTKTGTATAVNEVDESARRAVFKGLAILPTTPPELAVADFHNDVIRLYDANYAPIAPASGKWVDASVPAGFAPFNLLVAGGSVYVAYAKQDSVAHDDEKGPGNGAVSVFQTDGTLVKSLIPTGGALNSPWGMAVVPTGGWASLPAGTLLVGNFGDGTISAFDPATGALVGRLGASATAPLRIDGLWALEFWSTTTDAGRAPPLLYFTAGPNAEADGLFGYLAPASG